MMHFTDESVFNVFALHDKINPGKSHFMNYKMDIIEATINRARIAEDPTIFNTPTVGHDVFALVKVCQTFLCF